MVDISYSHSSTRESITDINLNIPKNSYIAFVGPSGSGKTTCVDVILGLLKPFSGNVMVDNQPLNKIDLNSFLGRVGYVQQTPPLLKHFKKSVMILLLGIIYFGHFQVQLNQKCGMLCILPILIVSYDQQSSNLIPKLETEAFHYQAAKNKELF